MPDSSQRQASAVTSISGDKRVLIASLYLPVTVELVIPQSSPKRRLKNAPGSLQNHHHHYQHHHHHSSSNSTSPVHKQQQQHGSGGLFRIQTDSMEATGPPSRYHYRTDSDVSRMPFQVKTPLSPTLSSLQELPPMQYDIVPSHMGNIGLHNAIRSSKLENRMYIGVLSDLPQQDKFSQEFVHQLTTDLSKQKCRPVIMSDEELHGHYNSFCKEILWPTMHYIQQAERFENDNAWAMYVAVNQRFADAIVEEYKQGDVIWIHDYHLMLVPMFVRIKIPSAIIGLFLHIPFPSSEVFRCLHVRRQLLEGVLGADLLGFQTELYVRHFLQTASRILQCESTPKGILLDNKVVAVGVYPIGVDIINLNLKRQSEDVQQMIEMLKDKYHDKKLIVGRDKLDPIKGVKQKLQAFEMFLHMYPEWVGKVILVQVAVSTTEHIELHRQISDLVTRINAKYGTIEYTPVVYLIQDISFSHYLALLTIADACLITSVRDGMNLTSHEYIVCQESNHNPLIISEFTGTCGILNAALRINPWDLKQVAQAINTALNMPQKERDSTHKELYEHVSQNTGAFWAQSSVDDLVRVSVDMQRRFSVNIPHLTVPILKRTFELKSPAGGHYQQQSQQQKRIILLNYDGVLVPYEKDLNVVPQQSGQMIKHLQKLCDDKRNLVYILSGRQMQDLDARLSHVQGIGLCAENGAFVKHPGQNKQQWTSVENYKTVNDSTSMSCASQSGHDQQWKQQVVESLEYYTERTPGSFIEVKETAVVWHYRNTDPVFGSWQAKELQNHIRDSIENVYPIHAVSDRKVIEVRPKSINKINVVQQILAQNPQASSVICIGDDRADEDVFEWLNDLSQLDTNQAAMNVLSKDMNASQLVQDQEQVNTQVVGSDGQIAVKNTITCCVGFKSSHAKYYLTGVYEVLMALQELGTL
ncbi:hypothetical protein MIR68_012310 [Amoeboaphelidium protococcarum]|nr:hypothetical protein MIR68_012310 [Amoeboaphelidium protococcarum]